ncbi:MAG: hypothetical protein IH831_10770 [Planctomycetes bacterium]|nr:hypothetical protein [Planctomycetota bacterium]
MTSLQPGEFVLVVRNQLAFESRYDEGLPIAGEYDGKVQFAKLNVDENPETAAKYRISSIPSVLVFKDGELVETLVGVQSKQRYQDALTQVTV